MMSVSSTLAAPTAAAAVAPSANAAKSEIAARREALLHGPIVPLLLKLALPTVVVLAVQTLVGVAETYFVSFLGTDAIAGVALVFPVLMLMQMMSNGGIGGGVASAVARALGAGRKADVDALVLNAFAMAIVFGALFTIAEFVGGRALYSALGGHGRALDAALGYADVVFAGAILVWIVSLLSAALRGAGNTLVPAAITSGGLFILLPLSPLLIFGWGAVPRLGVAGAGIAVVAYYLVGAGVLIGYLRSSRSSLKLSFDPRLIKARLLGDILKVGALSAFGTVQSNLTVVLVTGTVGLFGIDAIAGYGIASRLDYILVPLTFAMGSAALTMVGANMGAGQVARAERIAWLGGLIAAGVTETIGLAAALFPHAWLSLFSSDATVIATGTQYLHIVAPCYGVFGLGMLLYFAGQGAGHVLWPFFGGTARLVIAAVFGWIAVKMFGAGLGTLFMIVAASSLAFGGVTAAALALKGWSR
jgi:putative MATE family efflux protein